MTHASSARTAPTPCCGDAGEVRPRLGLAEAQDLAAQIQILAHPVRLQIIDVLAHHGGQVCVCDLEAVLPVKQPTVSHHLRLLRAAGLVDCECRGPWAYYFLRREALAALRARLDRYLARLE